MTTFSNDTGRDILFDRLQVVRNSRNPFFGLDPYVGFLHTDNYNKRSFVFDLIEMFWINIDRTVVNLFMKWQVSEKYFDPVPGGFYLNKEGKAFFISAVNEMFDKEIDYQGRNVKIRNTMQMECHHIANKLIK